MKLLVICLVLCVCSRELLCFPGRSIEWGVPQRRNLYLMVGGDNAHAQDFPWHATIFHSIKRRTQYNWEYRCGGSLVNRRFVLTAKHCTMEGDDPLAIEKISIKFGLQKYNRENENSQTRAVFKVYYVKGNLWEEFRNDIALVKLTEEVEITSHVLPVLLVDQEPSVGTYGTTVGFGFTDENVPSVMLQKLEMPVIDTRECIKKHDGFKLDLGSFCAGHTDCRTACNGDSGGGIVFLKDRKYYLGGIVSYFERQAGKNMCRLDGYSVSTSVYYYLPWINRIANLNVSLTKYTPMNDQPCGVSKVRRYRRIVRGQVAVPGQWPWNAKIYHKEKGSPVFRCGGSLISEKFVITTDSCIRSDIGRKIHRKLLVQLGASKLEEPKREFYAVEEIYEPQGERYAEYGKDIALLQLSNEVVIIFTDFVRPVCLPKADIEIGTYGTAIGFGFTEEDKLSTVLRMAQMSTIDCKEVEEYLGLTNDDIFCAGYSNGTTVCNGDSGGGIHFKGDNGAWYIGGIISFSARRENGLCALDKPAAFENIFMYLSWIQSVITSNQAEINLSATSTRLVSIS